jgi:hypothetical protein
MSDGKDVAPATPNYQPLVNATTSLGTTEQGQAASATPYFENLANENQATSNEVEGQETSEQASQNAFAGNIESQYENTYQPLENQYASEAQNWTSQGNEEAQMGMAESNTAQSQQQALQNENQNLQSYGINPGSPSYAGMDAALEAQGGAAEAAAGTTAYQNTLNTGMGLQATAIGQGEAMPGMAAGTLNTGVAEGTGAVNSGLATTTTAGNTLGTTPTYDSLANGAYSSAGNLMNTEYQNEVQGEQLNLQSEAMLGSEVGMGAGLGIDADFLMAKKGGAIPGDDDDDYPSYSKSTHKPFVDHHIYAIPGHDSTGRRLDFKQACRRFFRTGEHIGVFATREDAAAHCQRNDYRKTGLKKFAAGGDTGDDNDMTDGGGVPYSASPSRGAVEDDVPATTDTGQDLRLNAGEFVIPKDVSHWVGQRSLQALIDKSRKEKAGATAKPELKPAAAGQPKRRALDLGGGI